MNKLRHLAPFAKLFTEHIRFEEKALFETAQCVLGSEVLADMEQTLNSAAPISAGRA